MGSDGGSSQSSEMSREEMSITAPGYTGEMGAVLHSIMGGYSGLSKQDAINDVTGVLRTQASDALQSVMPAIAKATGPSGAYNSTTKDLLQNDAMARINAQLEATALDAITKYAGLENQRVGAFSDATKAGSSSYSEGSTFSSSEGSSRAPGSNPFAGILGDAVGGAIRGRTPTASPTSSSTIPHPADYGQYFADGGQVPTTGQKILQQLFGSSNIFARTNERREQEAGLAEQPQGQAQGGVVINIGGQPTQQQPQQPEASLGDSSLAAILNMFANLGRK